MRKARGKRGWQTMLLTGEPSCNVARDAEKRAAHLDAVGTDVERDKRDEALREQRGDHLADAAEARNDDMIPQLPRFLLIRLKHLHASRKTVIFRAYMVALSSRFYGGSDTPCCMEQHQATSP